MPLNAHSRGPRLLRILVLAALVLACAWATAALWVDVPGGTAVAGTLATVFALASALVLLKLRPWTRKAAVLALLFAMVASWWFSIPPGNNREWQSDVARLPKASLDGSKVTIENVRDFDPREDGSYVENWVTRQYDLDKVVGVDLFLSYWGPVHISHTIVSWEFSDGQHLAVSIETRKEVGESYSAVLGFFRQYEIYYVVAEERDLVGVRARQRGEQLYLYRTRASAQRARALLEDYLREINTLARQPKWYNALTHNCTTTIQHHTEHIGQGSAWDWRILANGHLDELLYERGSVDTSLPFEQLRELSDVTFRAKQSAPDAEAFSRQLRVGLPGTRGQPGKSSG